MKTLSENANRNEALYAINTIIETVGKNAFINECLTSLTTKYLIFIVNQLIRIYDLDEKK